MARRLSLLFLLAALAAIAISAWPLISCIAGTPEHAVTLITSKDPALKGLGHTQLCLALRPPYDQGAPFHLGLVCVGLSVIFVAIGRMSRKAPKPADRQGASARPSDQHTPRPLPPVNAIAVSESMEFSLGLGSSPDAEVTGPKDPSTLMDQIAFQEEERRQMSRNSDSFPALHSSLGGFYSPLHLDDSVSLYVDPSHPLAADTPVPGRGERLGLAFRTIQAALAAATRRIETDPALVVQLRLLPGTYTGPLTLPSQVVLVHHLLPTQGDKEAKLAWLKDLEPTKHVVLQAPEGHATVVRCEPGNQQGLFGLHIQGRQTQGGVVVSRSDSMRLWWCVIQGCGKGGICVKNSGREYSALGTADIHLGWSIIRTNKARQGAGLFAQASALRVEACHFEANHSTQGGACFLAQMQSAVGFERCEFRGNKAVITDVPEPHVHDIPPDQWAGYQGTGGAVYATGCQVKFHSCSFHKNGASVAGGALALLGSKAIVSGEAHTHTTRFRSNRARVASALLLAPGPDGAPATCRIFHALFEKNVSQRCGALMGAGDVTLELSHAKFTRNIADDTDGFGAACALFYGAKMLAKATTFTQNRAASAGALYALCASLKLRENVLFRANMASSGHAGALEFTTRTPPFGAFNDPLALELAQTRFVNNVAHHAPAALAVGRDQGDDDGELTVTLGEQVTVRSNTLAGQPERPVGEGGQARIQWRGKVVVAERAVYRPQALKLGR